MTERMFDLGFEFLEDGTIRLSQDDGGESVLIDLHPSQLRLLAERAGLLHGGGGGGAAARRLRIVTDKLIELAAETYFRDEIVARCSGGLMFYSVLDGLADLADEFSRDDETPSASASPGMHLRRRLNRINEDAVELYRLLASVPAFPPSADEEEDVRRARRLVEDIELIIADIDGTDPDTVRTECERHEKCHEKSAAITVTQPAINVTSQSRDEPRRGRPASGKAMTDAERQARRRERQQGQQELLPTQQEGADHE